MSRVTVVVGAQYGSEGKGAVAGKLASQFTEQDLAVRVAGPNAGHTAYDPQGREWKLRTIPVAAVTSETCQLHIAAGSEIDPAVLAHEIDALEAAGHKVQGRLTIHPAATIIEAHHIDAEANVGLVERIGSTGKGIGAARASRIMRACRLASDFYGSEMLSNHGPLDLGSADAETLIEGTQGYGLGLHTQNYPQVTSSDCRAIDFLAMAGISPWSLGVDLRVIVVARTYAIRVAGNSGPMLGETSWAQLGLPEERTTVTNKVRRVGAFDGTLVREALEANGGGDWNPRVKLAITMLDQMFPEVRDVNDPLHLTPPPRYFLAGMERELRTDIALVGTGPNTMIGVPW